MGLFRKPGSTDPRFSCKQDPAICQRLASIPRPVIVKQIKPSHRARTDLGSPPIPSCKKAASGAGLARSFPRKIECAYLCGKVKISIYFYIIKTITYLQILAERQGFEPWEGFHPQRFSRPPRSTTPAPLREESGPRFSGTIACPQPNSCKCSASPWIDATHGLFCY